MNEELIEDIAVEKIRTAWKEEGGTAQFGDLGEPLTVSDAIQIILFATRSQIELVESERDRALRELRQCQEGGR